MEFTSVIVQEENCNFNIFNNESIVLFNYNDIVNYLSNKDLKTINLNNLNLFLNYFKIDSNNFLLKKIIDNQFNIYKYVHNNSNLVSNCNNSQLDTYNLISNNNQLDINNLGCNLISNNSQLDINNLGCNNIYVDTKNYEKQTEVIINYLDENNNNNYHEVYLKNNYKPALFLLKDIEMYLYNQNLKYIEKNDFELFLNNFNLNPNDYELVRLNDNTNNYFSNDDDCSCSSDISYDDCSCSSDISYNNLSSNISDITFSVMSYLTNI